MARPTTLPRPSAGDVGQGSPGGRPPARELVQPYYAQAKDVALRRDVQVLTVREAGRPVAFAHIERGARVRAVVHVHLGGAAG